MKNVILNKILLCLLFILLGMYVSACDVKAFDKKNASNLFIPRYTFKLLPDSVFPRSSTCTATLLKDGRVLITGGMIDRSNSTDTAEIYDPKTNKFIRTPNMNVSRTGHAAILLDDGNVLITGGATYKKIKPYRNLSEDLKSAEIYDVKKNKFLLIEDMEFKMSSHQLLPLKNKKIISFKNLNDIEIFDQTNYKFEKYKYSNNSGSIPYQKGIILDNNNILLLSVILYDVPTLKMFTGIDNKIQDLGVILPSKRTDFSVEKIDKDKVLIIGGTYLGVGYNITSLIYNLGTNEFQKSARLNIRRREHSSITLNDKNILIVGGVTGHDESLRSLKETELYLPSQNKFVKFKNMHYARNSVRLVKLQNGNILILGGHIRPELLVVKKERIK